MPFVSLTLAYNFNFFISGLFYQLCVQYLFTILYLVRKIHGCDLDELEQNKANFGFDILYSSFIVIVLTFYSL